LLVFIVISVILVGIKPDRSVTISTEGNYGAIYSGSEDVLGVSLMFNVYENSSVVKKIIDLLNENSVTATFFVGGCWADDNQSLLKEIIESGFELGNHGYFHKDHKKLNKVQNLKEIEDCHKIVYALTGYKMTLFAPPSGSYSKTTLDVASSLNYHTIMWSKDTIDWRDKDVSIIVKRATNKVANGDLILMHPKEHTLKALPTILDYFDSVGLKQVKVSQNISDI
jgi:peptidoglycan/xylan/chitin deacetylase (PgdA/CDA1 family)